MKKLFFILMVFAFSFSLTNAQASKDGWALGFGLISPRIFGDVDAENIDFGGQFLIQKNLSEQDQYYGAEKVKRLLPYSVVNAIILLGSATASFMLSMK